MLARVSCYHPDIKARETEGKKGELGARLMKIFPVFHCFFVLKIKINMFFKSIFIIKKMSSHVFALYLLDQEQVPQVLRPLLTVKVETISKHCYSTVLVPYDHRQVIVLLIIINVFFLEKKEG